MLTRHYRSMRRAFYAGPRFSGIQPWRTGKYQSPTLTALLWAYALAARHFTTAGALVLMCCALVTLYALFTMTMPIHMLAFALIALLLLNVIAGFVFRPKISLQRRLPERLSAGSSHVVTYALTHRGRLPAWDVVLDPMPLPRSMTFSGGRALMSSLTPGEGITVSTTMTATRRGQYTLPEAMAGSAFPFHLWRWTAAGSGNRRVLVHPAFTPLSNLELASGLRYQAGGIALSSTVGNSMEFLGTREFHGGDDPRRIHWRSWARTSYPVVKEFREEYLCRTALIVDTHRPRPPFWVPLLRLQDHTFEAALSIAAAIADALSQRDYIIDLFAAGPEVYRFQGGRSLGFLTNILDILACLKPHREEPFAEFSGALIDEVARISSAVFILLTWNEKRRDLLARMQAAGVLVKGILITERKSLPDDLPPEIRPLDAKDILSGRCHTL